MTGPPRSARARPLSCRSENGGRRRDFNRGSRGTSLAGIGNVRRPVQTLFDARRLVVALMLLGAAAPGCYAQAQPPVVSAGIGFSPAYIDTYPSYWYGGRTVYLVDGRWWFRDRGRWSYYSREPRTLYRQRMYIQQAPRAPSRRYAPGAVPPRSSRPPATRPQHRAPPAQRAPSPRAPAPRTPAPRAPSRR